MLVEILGLPGAGKSTLVRELLPSLRKNGLKSRHGHKVVGLSSRDPAAPRFLRDQPDRLALFRAETFRQENAKLVKHMERKVGQSLTDQFLFSLTSSYYQTYLEYAEDFPFIFLDEGFIHRGVVAHCNGKETSIFADFLKLIPAPDAIVHVKLSADLAFERAVERRSDKPSSKARVIAKLGDLSDFRTRAKMLEQGTDAMVARGAALIEIDATTPPEACHQAALDQLLRLHKAQTAAPKLAAE
jgi:thymidylate kinase